MSLINRTLDGEDVDMVEVALERIRAHAVRPLCVMTSFGKDSEVIVDLV
jgi:3'-phosphoadenosine 5'-phosphosulfate sulfotransferase (PAPS reductase)/FAD synthetase